MILQILASSRCVQEGQLLLLITSQCLKQSRTEDFRVSSSSWSLWVWLSDAGMLDLKKKNGIFKNISTAHSWVTISSWTNCYPPRRLDVRIISSLPHGLSRFQISSSFPTMLLGWHDSLLLNASSSVSLQRPHKPCRFHNSSCPTLGSCY